MTRLAIIRLYRTEEVPDHILEEVGHVIQKMTDCLGKAIEGHDINIILSAFNRVHAAMIVTSMTEEGLVEAAKTEAIGLMKNIEHISGHKICIKKEEES